MEHAKAGIPQPGGLDRRRESPATPKQGQRDILADVEPRDHGVGRLGKQMG